MRAELIALGKQYGCAQLYVEKDGQKETLEVGAEGLESKIQSRLDPIFYFMSTHQVTTLRLYGESWIEFGRDETHLHRYMIQQGWSDSGSISHTFDWRPSESTPHSPHRNIEPKTVPSSTRTFEDLGPDFCQSFGVTAPYVAGAMAGGIASVELVSTMAQAGMLAFFGSGGLGISDLEQALQHLSSKLSPQYPWGCNVLHNPTEPNMEEQTVDLLLKYGVKTISASAYMRLTQALIRYRLTGLSEVQGQIRCQHRIVAKVSHPSVAQQFLQPAPQKMVQRLLMTGEITKEQADLAQRVPIADAITVEADSGGHTDSRPLTVVFPAIQEMAVRAVENCGYPNRICVGAAGGLGTPSALAAAFAMGADYVVLGSIHQCTLEAGTSNLVKEMLSKADVTDCALGIAPDMFEMGAHVQVLKKGTMYAQRSHKLYDLYKRHASIDEIPADERKRLERQIFGQSLDEIWLETERYWQREPAQLDRAHANPKYRMALIFRWYLGQSSRWARQGAVQRKKDFQIWCGPSMGAFNRWVQGTDLESWTQRSVVTVAHRLLDGVLSQPQRQSNNLNMPKP